MVAAQADGDSTVGGVNSNGGNGGTGDAFARTHAENARTQPDLLYRELTAAVIGCFYRVYDRLGYGFLESVYCNALARELRKLGIQFDREVPIDVFDEGEQVGHFRADFFVENRLIVELKAAAGITVADRKQLTNYLRGSRIEVGLILNFGPKATFQRVVFTNDRKRS